MYIIRGKDWMKLLVVGWFVCVVSGCAYDPADESDKSKPELHFSNSNEDQGDRGIDFVVNEKVVLTSVPEKIGRLIFMQDAVLSTDGADLNLVVDEVISHGGTISTLPISTSPKLGEAGRSGGSLHFEARTGRGHLVILAEGQKGGTGVRGSKGSSGPKGPRGNNGEVDYELDCMFASPELRSFDPDRPEPRPCFKRWFCSRQTGDGGRGGKGAKGTTGGAGGVGGSSAKVLVKIDDPSALRVSTEVSAGSGGVGGLGGDGGDGGAGGDPGSRDSRKKCRVANHGPNGPIGDRGDKGPDGEWGSEKAICLALGTARIGDCSDFDELTQGGVR